MATQKNVTEFLKEWQAAANMKEATSAASKTAKEFDGLYDESAMNLLGRTPDLMLLLSAYIAGKNDGMAEAKAQPTSVQEALT